MHIYFVKRLIKIKEEKAKDTICMYSYIKVKNAKTNLFSGLLVLLTPILQQQNFKDLQQQS